MTREAKKISPWRVAVVFGAMFVFVLGVPSLPGKHHLIYWGIAVVIEFVICVALLPFNTQNSN
jgi:hypothetical protein